jgi:WD40 repeat protein/serine/threonine protein kinase
MENEVTESDGGKPGGDSSATSPSNRVVEPEWHGGDRILDSYLVREVFTSGGMAYVYRVHHQGWGIDLAVKSPRQELLTDPNALEDFIDEAETWIKLGLYPHIVSCYFIRVIAGIPRIFVEYVEGGSLADSIEQGRLYSGDRRKTLARILDIAIQFAWGLQYAHEKGLIHQDVKPANVLLSRDGMAKVTDFGMARFRVSDRPHKPHRNAADPNQAPKDDKTTMVHSSGLTPAYCSPEQAAARPVSRRTDIWSWAVSILEMFTREKTWVRGQYALDGLESYLVSQALHQVSVPMPLDLAELLRLCFSFTPEERPKDMRLIAEVLQGIYAREIGEPYPRSEPRMETVLADTLNNRAVSMIDLGKEEEALQLFDEALHAESTHPAAIYNHSLFLWRKALITDQDAIVALQQNVKNLSTSWEPLYFLSLVHLERGDNREAARMLNQAMSAFGPLPPLKSLYEVARRIASASGGQVKLLHGSDSIINAVDISTQGSLVLSGSNDGMVRLWNAVSGQCARELTGHTALVHTVALSDDDRYALSGGWDNTVRYWDLPHGTCLHVMEGHSEAVQVVAFIPGGKMALSASADASLRLWDLENGQELAVLSGHKDTVWAAAVSRDGNTAVSASYDNTLRVWDLKSARCTKVINWVRSCTSNLSLSRDGKRALLAAGDSRLWLVDLQTGQPLRSFIGHPGGVNAVQVTPDDRWALSGGADGKLRLWDLESGVCLRTFNAHASSVNSIAIAAGKVLAATGGNDQVVRLWWLTSGNQAPYVTVLPRSSKEITELTSQMEDSLRLAEESIAAGDYTAAVEIVQEARNTPGYQQNPRLLETWNRLGRYGVRADLRAVWPAANPIPQPAEVHALAVTPDGRLAFTGGEDAVLRIWDLDSGDCLHELEGHDERILSIALAPARNLAFSASSDATLRVWDVATGACLDVLAGHTSEVNCVDITPDGRLGLSASNDRTLRLWDLSAGKTLRVLKGHVHYVRGGIFIPGGVLALSAGWDKTLRLWDLASGECLRVLGGHSEVIDALAVAPTGRLAASAGLDHVIKVWELPSGKLRGNAENLSEPAHCLTFSPDARYVYSGHEDGAIGIWRAADAAAIKAVKAHAGRVEALAAPLNGLQIISAGGSRVLKRWRLDWQYAIPAKPAIDDTGQALLDNFLYRHRPYANGGIQRSGKAAWEPEDFQNLLEELSYRGYGDLPANLIAGALRAHNR